MASSAEGLRWRALSLESQSASSRPPSLFLKEASGLLEAHCVLEGAKGPHRPRPLGLGPAPRPRPLAPPPQSSWPCWPPPGPPPHYLHDAVHTHRLLPSSWVTMKSRDFTGAPRINCVIAPELSVGSVQTSFRCMIHRACGPGRCAISALGVCVHREASDAQNSSLDGADVVSALY